MISFFVYKPPYIPQEADMYLAQYREQMHKEADIDDRMSLGCICKTTDRMKRVCDITDDQVKALITFAKKQKVPWQLVLMVFGDNLKTKVNLVVGYNLPTYTKAFLRRASIPVLDLVNPESESDMKEALCGDSVMDFTKWIMRTIPDKGHSETLVYDEEQKIYKFEDKIHTK